MKCICCNCTESRVVDSRPSDDGLTIRRRRECLSCGKRFTTYEKIEMMPVLVIKKDQRRENFDPEKVRGSMLRACSKRAVSAQQIEEAVRNVEQAVYSSMEREVESRRIGDLVMSELRRLDEVSYIRFASVYREFKDVNTFMEELTQILEENKHGENFTK